jgi:hypothetical protein
MADIQQQLKDAQARVKVLAGKRDQAIRDAGIEEQKLKQVYDNLRQLGIESPEALSEDDLQRLAEDTKKKLETEMLGLMETLSKGEALLLEYEKVLEGE